jgi:zinc protease
MSRRVTRYRVFVAVATLLTATPQPGRAMQAPVVASRGSGTAAESAAADTATTEFTVNGLRVILRRNTATDVVTANLFLLGGVQQVTPATQGIEAFILASSERGTKRYNRGALQDAMNRSGSSIVIDPEDDWTVFGLRAIRSTFDSSWAVFADRVVNPTLAPADVEVVRSQLLSGIRQARLSPDAKLRLLADSLLYQSQPYALAPEGTEASVSSLTPAMLREYQQREFVTSRMLLVVVGNVERARLESLIRSTIATLPVGKYQWKPPRPVTNTTRALYVERAALPTNYIIGYYAGPPAASKDYNALRIATAVLSGRFFTEIRSKRNLSYAVDAPFVERALATGGVYVTTVAPDAALEVMRHELDDLQTELVETAGLQRLVQQFITDYFLKNETNADQATFLARAALYDGDYRAANTFVDDLQRVRPEDVRRVAREYMKNFRFVYIGDPSKLSKDYLQRF